MNTQITDYTKLVYKIFEDISKGNLKNDFVYITRHEG